MNFRTTYVRLFATNVHSLLKIMILTQCFSNQKRDGTIVYKKCSDLFDDSLLLF